MQECVCELSLCIVEADQLLRRNKRTHNKLSDTYTDYMQAFAIHVKTIDSTTMQFMFKKIKKSDPEASFTVTVAVSGEKYSGRYNDPSYSNAITLFAN